MGPVYKSRLLKQPNHLLSLNIVTYTSCLQDLETRGSSFYFSSPVFDDCVEGAISNARNPASLKIPAVTIFTRRKPDIDQK